MNDIGNLQPYPYFVAVRFSDTGKAYYFGTDIPDLRPEDKVVVQTISGYEMGIVVGEPKNAAEYKSPLELKPIIRRPTADDLSDYELGKKEAEAALEITRREVKNLGLPMRLLEANYTLDGSKVTITYVSDNRVDFRELLKILAPQLKCRIELRQLAPRDRAKMIGGLGICGLPLCCSTFLTQFDGISVSRAKNQMLTLNIPKLSGQCGKLVCCLLYEDDLYTEAKKDFPKPGTVVRKDGVDYRVDGFNILSRTVRLVSATSAETLSLEEYAAWAKKSSRDTLANGTLAGQPKTA